MDATLRTGVTRVLRALLLGGLAVAAFVTLSLFASASSASAADSGSGHLGVAGSTVNGVADTADAVVEPVASEVVEPAAKTVEPAASRVVEPVATVVTGVAAPVTEVAPAPVAEVVTTVTDSAPAVVDTATTVVSGTATTVVAGTVDTANTVVSGTVDTASDLVSEVAGSGVVGAVVAPVIDTAESLPIVGGVVEQTGLGDVVIGVADTVDETLPVVVGEAPEIAPVVPSLPGSTGGGTGGGTPSPVPGVTLPPLTPPATPLSDVGAPAETAASVTGIAPPPVVTAAGAHSPSAEQVARLFRAAVTAPNPSSADVPSAPADSPAGDASHLALVASTGAGSSASTGSGASGTTAANADHGAFTFALTLLAHGGDVDDDLPGIPVYDTDASPD